MKAIYLTKKQIQQLVGATTKSPKASEEQHRCLHFKKNFIEAHNHRVAKRLVLTETFKQGFTIHAASLLRVATNKTLIEIDYKRKMLWINNEYTIPMHSEKEYPKIDGLFRLSDNLLPIEFGFSISAIRGAIKGFTETDSITIRIGEKRAYIQSEHNVNMFISLDLESWRIG